VYKDIVKTFSGYGTSVVSYETKQVKELVFHGWEQNIIADTYPQLADTYSQCYDDDNREW